MLNSQKSVCKLAVAVASTFTFFLLSMTGTTFAQDGQLTQSLNGQWQFTIMFDPTPEDWTAITVPGNWDVTDQHADHSGIGWYRRSFVPKPEFRGKRIRLKFDAVYHEAEIFLNRQRLGAHIGGYTPFEFDITDDIKFDQENTITVRADNSYQRGAWWPWGGISRSVNLIGNNDVRLDWQHIRTEPKRDQGSAEVFVRYRMVNAGEVDADVVIKSKLDDPAMEVIETSVNIPAGQTIEVDAQCTLDGDQVRLWHFDHPNLYALTTRLVIDRSVQHSQTDRFGIRKIEVTPTAILLNGEPVHAVGFNRVSDSPEFGNTEPDELVNLDVDLMKRCGAVMSRIMHYPQAPNFLDALDKKGMMVFCEIPVWQHDPQIITNNSVTKGWLKEMIDRDYNHPSIIGWSVGNEMRDFYPYASSMMKYVREELDPHRLVNFVSDRAGKEGVNEPIDETDIAMLNSYKDWGKYLNITAKRWPEKPVFLSEFGLRQLQPDGRFKQGFKEQWQKVSNGNPNIVGASLWTFNDYRSNFAGTQPTGFRTWGVVDENRKPKPAYFTLRKLFSPVRKFSVDQQTVNVKIRDSHEIPSYAMRNYKLRWAVENQSGEAVRSGEMALPDLKPDDDPLSLALPSDASAEKDEQLIVSLVTPLGYDVDDTRQR